MDSDLSNLFADSPAESQSSQDTPPSVNSDLQVQNLSFVDEEGEQQQAVSAGALGGENECGEPQRIANANMASAEVIVEGPLSLEADEPAVEDTRRDAP
ncbi:hypothetical protein NMY22_g10219 [Coprinellus aureogranulatus]|nr:hypothetical protein NMY22_g10219 [Coprinellus aureogranulatus]